MSNIGTRGGFDDYASATWSLEGIQAPMLKLPTKTFAGLLVSSYSSSNLSHLGCPPCTQALSSSAKPTTSFLYQLLLHVQCPAMPTILKQIFDLGIYLISKQNKPCLFQNFKRFKNSRDWSEATSAYSRKRKSKAKRTLLISYIRKIKAKWTLLIQELKKDWSEAGSAYSRYKNNQSKAKANSACSTH